MVLSVGNKKNKRLYKLNSREKVQVPRKTKTDLLLEVLKE